MSSSANTFNIHPVQRFLNRGIRLSKPYEVACFSYDDEHKLHLDDSSIRYYYPPLIGTDLKRGFDTFRKCEVPDEHLDSLLAALIVKEQEQGAAIKPHFLTWRGMMTKVLAAPYDKFSEFDMNATLFQGTIFIEEDNESKEAKKAAEKWRMKKPTAGGGMTMEMMTYLGYKFETVSVLPQEWAATTREYIESREDMEVSNHAQYCSIVKSQLGDHRLVLGGEVDAVWDMKPNWVELKTSLTLESRHEAMKYERKSLRIWAQSALLGVERIVVGFRDHNGIIQAIQEVATHRIPIDVQERGHQTWNGDACIAFADAFLKFLRETIVGEGVWRLRRTTDSPQVEVFRITEEGTGDILSPEFKAWRLSLLEGAKGENVEMTG